MLSREESWVGFRPFGPVAFFLSTCLVQDSALVLFWACRAQVLSQSLGEVTLNECTPFFSVDLLALFYPIQV